MSRPFAERNSSPAATRKIKALAKENGLSIGLVRDLANFTWDYDPDEDFDEPIGWVDPEPTDSPAEAAALRHISVAVDWPLGRRLTRERAAEDLLAALKSRSPRDLADGFLAAAPAKDRGLLSEFASFRAVDGLTAKRTAELAWSASGDEIGLPHIARKLFLKLFRAGAIERFDLDYLWADLVLPLPRRSPRPPGHGQWLTDLTEALSALPPGSKLGDLVACCKGRVAGDRHFKQEVLAAMAYAGILRVDDYPTETTFWPAVRNELSDHAASNEWPVPLRFWTQNGGRIDPAATTALTG